MDITGVKVNANTVQSLIKKSFGIEIPLNVIRYTFPKLARENILEVRDHSYHLRQKRYSDDEVLQIEAESRLRFARITNTISDALSNVPDISLTPSEVLEQWLDKSALSFLGDVKPAFSAGTTDYAINRLIMLTIRNSERGNTFVADLTEIALGDALFRAIKAITEHDTEDNGDYNDKGEATRSFKEKMKDVAVVFDTKIVLRSLLYVEDDLNQGTDELIRLCRKLSARISVFRHTVEEIQGIFRRTASNLMADSNAYGDIASYARREGKTPGDLLDLAAGMEEQLQERGFQIIDPPDVVLNEALSVRESELDHRLKLDLKQDSEPARVTDVKSLTAVHRMRKGEPKRFLEKCDAIFITSNKGLADSSVKFFRSHFGNEWKNNNVQICMTDVVFSTRLWVKVPTAYQETPRHQVIAHALGNLRPNSSLRDSFIRRIRELADKGILSDDDIARIQLDKFVDQVLALDFEVTTSAISAEEAKSIAEKVIEHQKRELEHIRFGNKNILASEKAKKEQLESRLSDALAQASEKDEELQEKLAVIERQGRDIASMSAHRDFVKERIDRYVGWLVWGGLICLSVFAAFKLDPILPFLKASNNEAVQKWADVLSGGANLLFVLLTIWGASAASVRERTTNFLTLKVIEFFYGRSS